MTNPCEDFDSSECQEALLKVYEYLDGHLTIERQTIIQTHIDVCDHCSDTYTFEMHVRKVVARRCTDQVPHELKAKIVRAIQQAQHDA